MVTWRAEVQRVRVRCNVTRSGVWWPPAGRAAAAGDESVGRVDRGRSAGEALCVGSFLPIKSYFGIMPEENGGQVK